MFRITILTTKFDSNYLLKKSYTKILEECKNTFEFQSFSTFHIDNNKEIMKEAFDSIANSQLVIYITHTGINAFKSFPIMMEQFGKEKYFFMHSGIEEENRELIQKSNIPRLNYVSMAKYFLSGGESNYINLLKYAANKLGKINIEYGELVHPQWEGIIHKGKVVEDVEEYLNIVSRSHKPIVGILCYGTMVHKNNIENVLVVEEEVESLGGTPIVVFTHTGKDNSIGAKGLKWSFDNLFTYEGKVLPEVIINTMGMSQSVLCNPGDGHKVVEKSIYEEYDIPIIQAMTTYQSYEQWKNGVKGLDAMSLTSSVYYPEFDGQVISVTTAYAQYESNELGDRMVYKPIRERINKVSRLALNWVRLKRTPSEHRKIAIIFHNMPPRNDMIGCAFGLDTPATVFNIVNDLKKEGVKLEYDFKNGDEIINKIIEGVSNDKRWMEPRKVLEKSIDIIAKHKYNQWFEELPEKNKKEFLRDWGEAPGNFLVFEEKMPIPGILNGNVFIGLQPSRGFLEKAEEAYHSTDLVPPHQYYAFYKWIKEEFGAHVIAHIGTHGTLEWLPGKEVGLDEECYPDIMIDDLPHLYPYSINITGEGMQVKRRSNGVILSHLISSMTLSEAYDDIEEIDNLIKQYYQAITMDSGKIEIMKEEIIKSCIKNKYHIDLNTNEELMKENFQEFLSKLHGYIEELKNNFIKDGLHIFGQCPESERLKNLIFALLRIDSHIMPSMNRAVAEIFSLDINKLKDNGTSISYGAITNFMLLDELNKLSLSIINEFSLKDFNSDYREECLNKAIDSYKGSLKHYEVSSKNNILKLMKYIEKVVLSKLRMTKDELSNFVKGSKGEFVVPGGSGCPTRGNINILPSGRNFYSIDPNTVPSRASYNVGKSLAKDLINRHIQDEGRYPRGITMVVYSGETMKTNGDDIAEALYLMGVRPIWLENTDRVIGLEAIPLEELSRPRIDVTLRISGLFRDTFPNLIELMEEAVTLVTQLNEPLSMNYIKANISKEIEELISEGISLEEASEQASLRVFGCPPGTYGAGVSILIESKQWTTSNDLGDTYATWSGYGYSKKSHGKKLKDTFVRKLKNTDITVKNESSKEIDMLESDDYYNYHGGLIASVKMAKGEYCNAYCGDSSDPSRTSLKNVHEQTAFIMRSRILNPKWFEGLKKHGYKGAQEISAMIDIAFGWDATSKVVEDWMYDRICDSYVLNKDRRDWINSVNKWAMHNMTERLLEANQRGMWSTSDERLKELRKVYMNAEGNIEDFL